METSPTSHRTASQGEGWCAGGSCPSELPPLSAEKPLAHDLTSRPLLRSESGQEIQLLHSSPTPWGFVVTNGVTGPAGRESLCSLLLQTQISLPSLFSKPNFKELRAQPSLYAPNNPPRLVRLRGTRGSPRRSKNWNALICHSNDYSTQPPGEFLPLYQQVCFHPFHSPYLQQPVATPVECRDDGRMDVAAVETLRGEEERETGMHRGGSKCPQAVPRSGALTSLAAHKIRGMFLTVCLISPNSESFPRIWDASFF